MKTFPQIAFDFDAGLSKEEEPIFKKSEEAPVPASKEEAPVNVGIRIKSLKQVAQTVEEVPVIEEPLVETPSPATISIITKKAKSTRGRKSIKQTAAEADLISIPEDEVLFRKQYYSMGEVTEMFKVNHSLLRYWENEFDIINPKKNGKGDRHFRPVDIKNLHLIYHLLRQRKYTIEGAKDFLKKNKKTQERFEAIKKLEQIKGFLLDLKANL
ncbi:MAG: MerR family transcriptional regulator [Bacteroidetes bacterium]|jgi:DNA-binding transcriptional MerR regulator|nr:MerR family transcriptional regulator [Bacteroidota bacterium]